MSTRTRKAKAKPSKPMTPAERRAKDFARVGLQPEASNLAANMDVDVDAAVRPDAAAGVRGNEERARRADAFTVLKDSMEPGAYDAARRLERDVLLRLAQGDHGGRGLEKTDGGGRDRIDAMVLAGRRVDEVLAKVGQRDAQLLVELIAPSPATALKATGWRAVVEYITGETNPRCQASEVRGACANLAAAYRVCDAPPRKAA